MLLNALLWNVVKCWAFVGSSNYPWKKYWHDVDASGETVENDVPCQRTSHHTTYMLKFPQVREFVIIFLTVNHIKLHFPLKKTSIDVASAVLGRLDERWSSSSTCWDWGPIAADYFWALIHLVSSCQLSGMESI